MHFQDMKDNFNILQEEINQELVSCGRKPNSITLVGVSKKQPLEKIITAISAGIKDIGENYVQEAEKKFALLPPVRKHFLGHIQTNKSKELVQLFDVVQSVDRSDAVIALNKAAGSAEKIIAVLLQINISQTERFGCPKDEVEALADLIRLQPNLKLDGIMAIGPNTDNCEIIAQAFSQAADFYNKIGGNTLSLGMTHDWRLAIRAGCTMVRIGTGLFGSR